MKRSKIAKDHVDHLGCPVVGHEVAIISRQKPGTTGRDCLTYFSCAMEGHCGISLWDPCPLYVISLEKTAPKA